jgi:hypothetical protein
MNRKAYRATCVKDVNWDQLARGREGVGITLGVDVGKYTVGPFVDGPMVVSSGPGGSTTRRRFLRCLLL